MQWVFIACVIVLTALVAIVAAFSLRESYRLTLVRAESAAERVRTLTQKHIDIYEKTYALIFFFGGELSSDIDKKEFSISDETRMADLPAINKDVDLSLSDICQKIESCESLIKERGASFKKTVAEIEALERDLIAETASFNKYASRARLLISVRPFKRLLKDIGKCPYKPINV